MPLFLYPQNHKMICEHLSIKQGLSNNTITCLFQDSKGFIWIGTEDGLSRYDGYTFRRYAHDQENLASLSHNNIQVIYEDSADSGKVLWIGTKGGGLNRFDLETGQFVRYLHVPNDPTSLSDSDVECIFKDSRGVYWIGTGGGGLNRFDRKSGKFVSYQHNPDDPHSLSRNNVSSICEDHLGNLWIATLSGGLNKLTLYNNEKDTVVSRSIPVATWTTHPVAEVWEYQTQDSSAQTWKKKSDMPTARCFSSSCTIDGRIYVVGGLGHRKPPVSPSVPNLEVYDPAKNSWERLADMKVARAGISVSVVDKKIYAIGGFATQWTWGTAGVVVEEYNLDTNAWTRKTDMPEKIGDYCAVVLDNKIFVLGGCNDDESLSPALNTVKIYDPVTEHWSDRADMKVARSMFASCVLGGKIYVMGGQRAPGNMAGLKSVEVYDPVQNSWKELKEMPGARWGHTAAAIDGKIRIFGGVERRYLQDSVFEYDPQLDSWTILPDMPVKRAVMSCAQLNGKIYLIGGNGFTENFIPSKSDSLKNIKFIHYRLNRFEYNSLPSDHVYSIYEDRQGTLWIGTRDGLCKFDRNSARFIRHRFDNGFSATLNSIPILSIYEDSKGGLWISTQGGGIFQINGNREHFIQYELDTPSSSALGNISSLLQDRSGIIWVGTRGSGIIKLIPEGKRFHHFRHIAQGGKSRGSQEVSSISNDNSGKLWIGTADGVLKEFDEKSHKFFQYYFDSNRSIDKFLEGQNGELWLARGRVLTKFNPASEESANYYGVFGPYFTPPPSILHKWLDDLREQRRPIAAITQVGNNENITREFEIDKRTALIIIAQGEAIFNDLKDRAWLTDETGKKILWQMEAIQTRHAGGAARNRIQLDSLILVPGKYQIHYHSNAEHTFDDWIEQAPERPSLWGVSVFSLPPFIDREIQPLFARNDFDTDIIDISLNDLCLDQTGTLWCLINSRLYHFDESLGHFIHHEILIVDQVIDNNKLIYQDRSGTLWIGTTNHGLIKRLTTLSNASISDEVRYKQYKRQSNDPNSLGSNNIQSIYEDLKGLLWIVTDRGLSKLDIEEETFKNYTEKDGLPSNVILAILDDEKGNLWISTPGGLSKFDSNLEVFQDFDERDGLPMIGFNNSCNKGPDGKMYFGGSDGCVVFHPESLQYNTYVPPVAITNLQIFNKTVLPGDGSPLRKSITHSREIELKHDQDIISFEFTALDYTSPQKNQFAHKMEGVDQDWVFTDASRRFATYTNLDPGQYTFRVKGSNNDGIWNEEGTSIKIIILPPWWQSNLAYSAYFLIFVLVLYVLRSYDQKRQRLKHKFELEHLHAEKLAEIDKIKSTFFTNISHEFRTPLTLISGPAKQIMDGSEELKTKDNALLIYRNAKRLNRLVDQLLDLSKIEAGEMRLRTIPTDIISFLKELVNSFAPLAEKKNITFRFKPAEEHLIVYLDKDKVEKIINNILSNAFKFTSENGEILIRVSKHTKFVEIYISDTGIGISKERLTKIFDRFYQVDGSHTKEQEGTGIGLALTKELVELQKGEIQVESQEGKGTIFIIRLPLSKKQFKPEEIYDSKEKISADKELSMANESGLDKEKAMIGLIEETDQSSGKEEKPLLLIVEDSTDVQNYMRGFLKNEYQILEATDGEDGFKKSINQVPDIIVSDIMMPKIDGFQLCEKLKTDERTSHIPVILLTAKATSEDKIEGLETGADDYVMKPFDEKELKARIKNLIEQRKKLREYFLKEGIFNLDNKKITSIDKKFFEKTVRIINEHLSDSLFGVETLARELTIGRTSLHKKIMALVGEPPGALIKRIRLSKAGILLKNNIGNISEIALEVGFNNPAYFSECFKRQFGVTPSQYLHRFTNP